MKKLLALTALLTLAACSSPPAAPGAVVADRDVFSSASFSLAPGDTLRYTLSWTPGARAQGYAVTTTVTQGSGWTNLLTNGQTTGTSVAFTPVHLTAWDSVSFRACVSSTAPGKANSSATCVDWTLVRGPTPPGGVTVDSTLVIAMSLNPGNVGLYFAASQQFCTFWTMGDGFTRLTLGQDTVAACRTMYDALPVGERLPGYPAALASHQWAPAEQAQAIRMAVMGARSRKTIAEVLFAGPFST
jgi:hypothetical protein